ncbi:MAG: hypothetical protein KGN33_09510 [Paracoccaceae bacterium]|nr:hypothetical protein [Paracoccaceae bacterium]
MIDAGNRGVAAAELPSGLRVSGFVLKLRRAGVSIETLTEVNTGEYGGHHGRYRLAADVERVDEGGPS